MNNKRKGFSIAELLIALLIISIVLAAAIPAITKKNTAGGEKIWRWAGKNNSAFFGVGQNQSAIISFGCNSEEIFLWFQILTQVPGSSKGFF